MNNRLFYFIMVAVKSKFESLAVVVVVVVAVAATAAPSLTPPNQTMMIKDSSYIK